MPTASRLHGSLDEPRAAHMAVTPHVEGPVPEPGKRIHYPALDGLRGIAVLVVMLLHFTLFTPSGWFEVGLSELLNAGWVGVDLFFVLSGFLITGILIDTREDPHYFRNFYARRTLRIFPLYYAYLFLLFVVLPAISPGYAAEHAASDRRIWLWTYLGNILMGMQGWEGMPSHTTHLWSLAVEEQFYLIWPLLVYHLPRRRLGTLAGVTFAIAVLTRAYLATQGAWAAGYVLTPARVDTLAAGAGIAVLLRDGGPEAVRRTCRAFLPTGLVLIGLGIAWNLTHAQGTLLSALDPGTQALAYPGFALAFAALVGWSVVGAPFQGLVRFLSRRSLRTLGKYSYALYLIHVPLRNALWLVLEPRGGVPSVAGSPLPAQVAITLAGILASLLLASLSWRCFERPILRLKRHFEAGAPVGAATAASRPRPSTP